MSDSKVKTILPSSVPSRGRREQDPCHPPWWTTPSGPGQCARRFCSSHFYEKSSSKHCSPDLQEQRRQGSEPPTHLREYQHLMDVWTQPVALPHQRASAANYVFVTIIRGPHSSAGGGRVALSAYGSPHVQMAVAPKLSPTFLLVSCPWSLFRVCSVSTPARGPATHF